VSTSPLDEARFVFLESASVGVHGFDAFVDDKNFHGEFLIPRYKNGYINFKKFFVLLS